MSKVTFYHVHCLSSYQDHVHSQQDSPLERLEPNILRDYVPGIKTNTRSCMAPYPVFLTKLLKMYKISHKVQVSGHCYS